MPERAGSSAAVSNRGEEEENKKREIEIRTDQGDLNYDSGQRNFGERVKGFADSNDGVLTRHGMAVQVIANSLLKFVVWGRLLEPLAQVAFQILVELVSCRPKHKQQCYKHTVIGNDATTTHKG